jgi:uncharacterized protein (TIGR03000 family)
MHYLTFAALAAALLIPNVALAQKGGGHGGGAWHGGGGNWHGGGGHWNGGTTWHGGNNWHGGTWNGNWHGGYYGHGYYGYRNYWYPWVSLGLGYALGAWGWGGYGYGWGWPYYYTSPGYYYTSPSYYTYDYPTYYATPSTSYYDSYPRSSTYYDAQASARPDPLTTSPYRAKVEIFVADSSAQLIVEGQPVPSAGSRRYFVSPELEPGKKYLYTITLQSNISGRPEEDTREIEVQAGGLKRVDFTQPVIHTLPPPGAGSGRIPATRQIPPAAVPPK